MKKNAGKKCKPEQYTWFTSVFTTSNTLEADQDNVVTFRPTGNEPIMHMALQEPINLLHKN